MQYYYEISSIKQDSFLKKKKQQTYYFSAIYAFPRIEIPKKAIEYAKSKNMTPDEFYCFQLLDKTGICVLSGSDFKQRPGTYNLRTTFLPPIDQMKEMVERFRTFHMSFLHQWK
ncbi:unnamed protein product [Rotaria sp. Silwood1]|nr:unnamed protein product [Rotaria sp. Silwood1]CAF3745080.1 unnamed protein product [Rotaria sp. Silwood1]